MLLFTQHKIQESRKSVHEAIQAASNIAQIEGTIWTTFKYANLKHDSLLMSAKNQAYATQTSTAEQEYICRGCTIYIWGSQGQFKQFTFQNFKTLNFHISRFNFTPGLLGPDLGGVKKRKKKKKIPQ